MNLIVRNRAAIAKPPVAERVEHETWTSDDVIEFFAGIEHERVYPLFVLSVTTGMRIPRM